MGAMESAEIVKQNNELFAELKKYSENSPDYQRLVAKIVENNVPLVAHVAKRYYPDREFTLTRDDLFAEGLSGLLYAVKSFKPEKDIPFANYAAITIRGYILRYLRQERRHKASSLEEYSETNVIKDKDLVARGDFAAEFVEKDEKEQRLTWVRKNFDRLTPFQKQVITAKYFSSEKVLTRDELAQKFKRWPYSITVADEGAITKLRKLYFKSHPEAVVSKKDVETKLTPVEKIATKQVLKDLIATELAPQQKKTTLCKFFSAGKKTNQQVAEELNIAKRTVCDHILRASERLCTLYNRSHAEAQLSSQAIRNILKIRTETKENEKER
ncbi:MAG: sigma-70 family RNA polymerase sigma factor [Prevotella sp.]|nr:sigma-70 family RNA polymerase sigma factor [Prevotella sp.]